MKDIPKGALFDADLTPKNAEYKGYEYIDDVILLKNHAISQDFIKILQENNFKLGIPDRNEYGNYGLYIPKEIFERPIP